MPTPLALTLSVVFGVLGFAYLTYGWKQKHIMATVAGIGMLALPMLTSQVLIVGLVGVLLAALPWLVRY